MVRVYIDSFGLTGHLGWELGKRFITGWFEGVGYGVFRR